MISYIKKYDKRPVQYVIAMIDSQNVEKTIGKVHITNFADVNVGDTVRKLANSFKLEIHLNDKTIISRVLYD